MIGFVIIKETGATPQIAQREQRRIMQEALSVVAANHHEKFMPKHFRIDGAREYNYKPRKGEGLSGKEFYQSYTGRKNREKGHMNPLVWSGVSRTLAGIRDVRATKDHARLVQHARGLNRRNPNSQINMAEEIRTVSEREARVAAETAGQEVAKRYKNLHVTVTTKIG